MYANARTKRIEARMNKLAYNQRFRRNSMPRTVTCDLDALADGRKTAAGGLHVFWAFPNGLWHLEPSRSRLVPPGYATKAHDPPLQHERRFEGPVRTSSGVGRYRLTCRSTLFDQRKLVAIIADHYERSCPWAIPLNWAGSHAQLAIFAALGR